MTDEAPTIDLPRMRANRILRRAQAHVDVLRYIAANGLPKVRFLELHQRVEEFAQCPVPEEALQAMIRVVGGGVE